MTRGSKKFMQVENFESVKQYLSSLSNNQIIKAFNVVTLGFTNLCA